MKVLQINIFGNLSTGRIAVDLYRTLAEYGHTGILAFARNTTADNVPYIRIGSKLEVCIDGVLTRITDRAGFFSKSSTRKLISEITQYEPDIVHIHNLHGYYINVELLFDFLKIWGKPVVWTLHDCWPYTGHCCYYSMVECNKWQTECSECPQTKAYPASLLVDNSRWNYKRKRELFTSLPNLNLVTVSNWLEKEVGKSFLKKIPCRTIYSGIDLNVFRPMEGSFRKKYSLENKIIVLGVASTWDVRKGLNDFIRLSKMLDEDYRIVIVGVNESEKRRLTSRMIGISRTDSVQELAEIYSAADVFFNASVEETFGLPTVEAMACGTPAIVYNATALPEVVNQECGYIVEPHDLKAVVKILKDRQYETITKDSCIKQAEKYEKHKQFTHYIELYESLYREA